jgi:AcrR family transcriptional regulator
MADAKDKKRQAKNKTGEISGTKLELTLAAERVFALNGLRGTTLRQIREAAGQKNESVIHYHFGSRDAIIEAILFLRSQPINEVRLKMLAAAREESSGGLLSAEQISRCSMVPLAEFVLGDDEPGHCMRFLAQLRNDREARRKFGGRYDSGLRECLRALQEAMPYLPSGILERRFVGTRYMQLAGMAAIEEIKTEKGAAFRTEEAWVRVEDMIGTAAAMYGVPLSVRTVSAIQRACEHQPMPTYVDVSLKRG